MKKIIITRKQLFEGALDVNVKAADNSASSYAQAATAPSTTQDLNNVGKYGDANLVVSGPEGKDDSKPTLDVDVPKGSTVQNTISSDQSLNSAIEDGASIEVHGDGFVKEGKTYTKRFIQEARLKKMREEGTVMTKKEFNNMLLKELNEKKSIINKIHKIIDPYTSHLYSDNDWKNVRMLLGKIENIPFVTNLDVSVPNGGYGKSSDGLSKWKDYDLSIETEYGITINGKLTCSAAGTIEDPFGKYDMCINLW